MADTILNDSKNTIKDSSCILQSLNFTHINNRLMSSQTNEEKNVNNESASTSKKSKKPMSTAMKFYLERKKAHDSFIAKERSEFELGKKHLANMMGMNYEAMTQEDVDKAIEYLFPSGLYDEEARPKMKPPEEIFPRQKDAEFNEDGRPFHPFFYTTLPNFGQTMYELVDHIENLTFFADRMSKQNKSADPTLVISDATLGTTRWMTKEELKMIFHEEIRDKQVNELIDAMERLLENQFAYKVKDFIFKFRKPIAIVQAAENPVEPQFDENGRASVEYTGQRMSAVAKVKVTKPGTGVFKITHIDYPEHESDIRYFFSMSDRHTIMYPLQFTKLLGLVDVNCIVDSGGSSGQAGAVRYALSMCLRSLVEEETATEMKVAGLVTQDVRVHERKKYGRPGAREKFKWNRR